MHRSYKNRRIGKLIGLLAVPAAICVLSAADDPTPRVIASSTEPSPANAALEQMQVVLLADEKDHGPAGNGLHDYPLWQKRWAALLCGD